jgi:protein gp37
MGEQSDIEWTDATWNPVRGCKKVSPGCKHCYAETFAERWRGIPGHAYEQGFDPRLVPEMLDAPLRWKRPRKIFVNSMSDLFGEFVPDDYIAAVFGVMAAAKQHTFQVLTKRAERLPEWFDWLSDGTDDDPLYNLAHLVDTSGHPFPESWDLHGSRPHIGYTWPLPNVHLGVSVEDRKYGLPRIEHLRNVPAVVRFLSIEPLLEDLGTLDLTGIGWVIVGGESGLGARPMRPDWVRSIRDQCVAAGVPFFFKQWGGVLKKKAGRELDGRTWDELPKSA